MPRTPWLIAAVLLAALPIAGKADQPQVQLSVIVAEIEPAAVPLLGLQTPPAPAPTIKSLRVLDPAEAQQLVERLHVLRDLKHAKILAEPRLMTQNGREANFLSGGQVAVPTPDAPQPVSVEFEPFGTSVHFLPTVLDNGLLHLEVKLSRTTLTANAGRDEQRFSTTTEMKSGQTLAVRVPGQDKEGKTEQVVLITPEIVSASAPVVTPVPAPGLTKTKDGQVKFRCAMFDVTADHLVQNGDTLQFSGHVRLMARVKQGEIPAEIVAEKVQVRPEEGRLKIEATGK